MSLSIPPETFSPTFHPHPHPQPPSSSQPQPTPAPQPRRLSNKGKRKFPQLLVHAGEEENQDTTARSNAPFLNLPPEILFKIFELVDTLDGVCFSLVCKKLYILVSPFAFVLPLSSGSPSSAVPHPLDTGCRHCVPVLFSPAHCELHFHIRAFFPARLTYCINCDRFTRSAQELTDQVRCCGGCGIDYRRRFRRGRRMLAEEGSEGKEDNLKRGSRWFNVFG